MQNKENAITQEQVAEKLLWGLWRSLDENYKTTYVRNIWEQFEGAIRSASYTGSLKVFLSNFAQKLPVAIQAQHTKDMLGVIKSGQDEQILNWLREETVFLCMLVRIKNQGRKDDYKKAQAFAELEEPEIGETQIGQVSIEDLISKK